MHTFKQKKIKNKITHAYAGTPQTKYIQYYHEIITIAIITQFYIAGEILLRIETFPEHWDILELETVGTGSLKMVPVYSNNNTTIFLIFFFLTKEPKRTEIYLNIYKHLNF